MTSILHQEILPQHLPNYATSIDVRKLTLQTSGAIAKHVRDNDVEVLGVSLRLASDGTVDAVAFATPTVVFYLRSAGKAVMSSSSKTKAELGRALRPWRSRLRSVQACTRSDKGRRRLGGYQRSVNEMHQMQALP